MVVFDCFILRHEFDEDPYRAEGSDTQGGWSRSHVRGLGENHPPTRVSPYGRERLSLG